LWMLLVDLLGCILFPLNLMLCLFFIKFQTMVERLLNTKIKSVQTDWGANITTSTNIFNQSILFIVSHARTLINNKDVLSGNINISLIQP